MKANTCSFWGTWNQATASFQTALCAASQGNITHSQESAIYSLLHPWAWRQLWLASIAVIDRGKRAGHLSHPESTAKFALLHFWPCIGMASSGFDDKANTFLPTTQGPPYYSFLSLPHRYRDKILNKYCSTLVSNIFNFWKMYICSFVVLINSQLNIELC